MIDSDVTIRIDAVALNGRLAVPDGAIGLVVFAHGSGSSRLSPRNNFVGSIIRAAGMGTLLIDLLTATEAARDEWTGELRFDIRLLADRLHSAAQWARSQTPMQSLPLGYFGASTGGGAALLAAAEHPASIAAVVSRGGRPDLAGAALRAVRAPTLLLVGELDAPVIRMNESALRELRCEKQLTIIPGASHLFEEPGTLEQVAEQAARWFAQHFENTTV